MSLQHSVTTPLKDAAPGSMSLSSAMRRIFSPLVRDVRDSYRTHRIMEARKATQREISALPGNLQEDLAFEDGTVVGTRWL